MAYIRPCQTTVRKLFDEIVNCFIEILLPRCFSEKLLHRCLTGSKILLYSTLFRARLLGNGS